MKFLAIFSLCIFLFSSSPAVESKKLAQWLVSLQDEKGAIPDAPGWDLCNLDSNMEYALLGIAAAYWKFKDYQFKEALRRGIIWLANREEMKDPFWRGSWYYAYSCTPSYPHIPISPGKGIVDARGVDSTSALFLYLLWLYGDISGDFSLWSDLRRNAKYALEFLMKARLQNGFFRSSWHFLQNGGWRPYNFNYTADQGDVYLGLWSGWKILSSEKARIEALTIKFNLWKLFDKSQGIYSVGIEGGHREVETKDPSDTFPQGYIPWIFGVSGENFSSLQWLQKHQEEDGGFRINKERFRYALPAIVYIMGMKRFGFSTDPSLQRAEEYLLRIRCPSGGIRDDENLSSPCFSNLTGLAILALLGFPPMVEDQEMSHPY